MSGHKRGSPPQISRRATTSARISHREELEVPMVATAKKSRSVSVVDVLLERADDSTRVEKTRRKKSVVKHNVKSLRSMIYGLSISAEREEAEYAKLQRRLRVQEEKAMQAAPSAPIDASKFVAYVTERRKKRILFKGEYLMILRSIDATKCHSDIAQTMGERNQYPDTLPYDYNRVILRRLPNNENSQYINASYVNSWLRERAYVVTQAVKTKSATADFWRMIWELGSNCIVMLTKVFDFMRVVCLQYWPVSSAEYGDIGVETLSTKTYAHFVIRTLRLTRVDADVGQQTRMIKQFHFTEWELDSFPYISAFIELRRRVRNYVEAHRSDAPIVVHCSNGGGRSGAFIALDANLELMKKTDQIDVYEYAKTMVNSRPHLVDSVDQYQFIYDALAEAVLCNIEPIEMWQLKERSSMYKAKRDRQLMEAQDAYENKLLMMLTPTLRIGDCAGGHRLENRGKNRDVMVVPPDHARPYLQTLHGESKDYTYINAVEVDGFTRKNEFIVTEWPKHSTIDSFWTLVFDHSCHTIVNLSNQGNTRTYPTFLHTKGKRTYGPFVVEVLNYHQYPSMTSHMVKVMKKTFMISEIMATGANQQQLEAEVRICCVIQVRMWPIENKVPLSTSGLIDMIKMARSWRKRAPDRPETKPTIVMSHNGVSRCGIFIAANVCIDQMNMDHEVDVFHAVKMIRINRPQLIDMKDEYKYLYDLMLHWYMTNPEYRRFDEEGEDSPMGGNERRTSLMKSRNSSARRSSRSPRTITDANHVL
uniref:Uncharacterized protein n=1 Tax=Parascaris univalens TaxID=6257 RepID=A0A915BWH4_PARUN